MAASTLLAVPELYSRGQRAAAFNVKVYLGWVFMAASEAMIIFFVMLGLYGDIRFTNDNGLYAMGVLTYSASVILISTKLQYVVPPPLPSLFSLRYPHFWGSLTRA